MLKYSYRYKFYLDANHYVTFDDVAGEIHPHSWEIAVDIQNKNNEAVQFSKIEATLQSCLEKYQGNLLNDVEPFTTVNPTLENIGEYFTTLVQEEINNKNWDLLHFEISETPSRSYITLHNE